MHIGPLGLPEIIVILVVFFVIFDIPILIAYIIIKMVKHVKQPPSPPNLQSRMLYSERCYESVTLCSLHIT